MTRRVISTDTIDELLAASQTECRVGARDIVTELAAEYAQERGVRLVRDEVDEGGAPTRAEVRRAVIGVLGTVPDGLDAAIDKVMER